MKTLQPIPILQSLAVTALETDEKATAEQQLPLKTLGTTYSMAQSVRWLDESNFAIGRWDGTLTIFHRTEPDGAPVVSDALIAPSFAGVEMISRVKDNLFASSNDAQSIAVWLADEDFEGGIRLVNTLRYDAAFGAANDGTTTEIENETYFVSGHANGWLLVWRVRDETNIELLHSLDLRSPNPIPSPYPLKNIRGVERWQPGVVVTGSEDGDICLVDAVRGKILARQRYNETAERGINDIDTCGDYLVLANCSVAAADKNLWLYRIREKGFELLDAVNLKVNETAPQIFNFCVDQAVFDNRQYFVAATQEGVVWVGRVEENSLVVLGKQDVSTQFGAALALQPETHLLAVAGDNLHLFELQ